MALLPPGIEPNTLTPEELRALMNSYGGGTLDPEFDTVTDDIGEGGQQISDDRLNKLFQLSGQKFGTKGGIWGRSAKGLSLKPWEFDAARYETSPGGPFVYTGHQDKSRENDSGADFTGAKEGIIAADPGGMHDPGFGHGIDFGNMLDKSGDFDLGFMGDFDLSNIPGTLSGPMGQTGAGLAGIVSQALSMGVSLPQLMSAMPQLAAALVANPAIMTQVFGRAMNQAFDRHAFSDEVTAGSEGLGLDVDSFSAGDDPNNPGALGQQAGIREVADILSAHREHAGIGSSIADLLGLDNAAARNITKAETFAHTPAGEHAANVAREAEAEHQIGSDFFGTDISMYSGPSFDSSGSIFSASNYDPATNTYGVTGTSRDTSGMLSRNMGIHGGTSATEAEMAVQDAAGGDGGGK
jgi:hypothetical protein